MPLNVNVGLSRKASQDYQSQGKSINLSAELDQSLLLKPDELQRQIQSLYRQAELALDSPQNGREQSVVVTSNGHSTQRNGHQNHARSSMSQAQSRAIYAIAKEANVDPDAECQQAFGITISELDVRSASRFIDHLKSLQTSAGGRRS